MTFHTGMAKRRVMLCALFLVVPATTLATSSRGAAAFASQTCVSAPGNVCLTNGGGTALATGAMISGSLSTGGEFAPGTLTINVISWDNLSGVLFRGTFGDPTAGGRWAFTGITGANRRWNYNLARRVGGTWYTGTRVFGSTAQFFFNSRTAYNGAPITLSSGTASILTPEPASIGLLGTGLVLMGFLVRRRVKRDR